MPSRCQVLARELVIDGAGHLVVGHRGIGGGHVGDQVREYQVRAVLVMPAVLRARPGGASVRPCRRAGLAGAGRGVVAGLGNVQLVAQPELLSLDAPAGVGVIRGGDPDMAGRRPSPSGSFSRRLITSRPSPVMVRV